MRPDCILIPNGRVNPEVPDLNAAYAAAAWGVPVIDLNSGDRQFAAAQCMEHTRIALSVRTFARGAAAEICSRLAPAGGGVETGFLRGPLDVLCCYRYLEKPPVFDPGLSFDDSLPLPAFQLFDNVAALAEAWRSGRIAYPLLTSLGCPYGCRFCAAARRGWRPLSPDRCATELREAKARWGIASFQVLDDCFNRDAARVQEFCRQVEPLGLVWFCNNGLRADCFSADQARAMQRAGCRHVTFGIEAADDAMLRRIGKGETLAQITTAIDHCHAARIPVSGFFLVGLPGATVDTDLASLAWAREHRITPHFSYYVPAESRDDGNTRFWGHDSRPASDAYPAADQERVYRLSRAPDGMAPKIVRNTLFNLAGRGAGILLALVITPYIVVRLGAERFGIWSLVSLVTGYVGLLDFGLRDSFVKYIAEFHARHDRVQLHRLVNTGFFVFLVWALPVTAVGLWGAGRFPDVLRVPEGLTGEAVFAFMVAVVLVAGQNLFAVFEAVPVGLQRMGLANALSLVFTVLTALGSVLVLAAGWGLRGLLLNALALTGLRGLAAAGLAVFLQPGLRLGWHGVDLRLLGSLSRFGFQRWVSQVEEIATFQTDKLIISNFSGLSFVGFYQLGFSLVDKVSMLPRLLGSAVVPAAAELAARRSPELLARLYREGTRYVLLTAAPLFAFVFTAAPVLLSAWMGPGYADSAMVARLFAAAFFLMSLTTVSSALAVGIGRPGLQMVIGGVQAIANVTLSIFLARRIGFLGPVVASVICLAAGAVGFNLLLNRHLRLAWHEGLSTALRPLTAAVAAALGIWLLQCVAYDPAAGRGAAIGLLAAEGAVFGLLYAFGAWLVRAVRQEDVTKARGYLLTLRPGPATETR